MQLGWQIAPLTTMAKLASCWFPEPLLDALSSLIFGRKHGCVLTTFPKPLANALLLERFIGERSTTRHGRMLHKPVVQLGMQFGWQIVPLAAVTKLAFCRSSVPLLIC